MSQGNSSQAKVQRLASCEIFTALIVLVIILIATCFIPTLMDLLPIFILILFALVISALLTIFGGYITTQWSWCKLSISSRGNIAIFLALLIILFKVGYPLIKTYNFVLFITNSAGDGIKIDSKDFDLSLSSLKLLGKASGNKIEFTDVPYNLMGQSANLKILKNGWEFDNNESEIKINVPRSKLEVKLTARDCMTNIKVKVRNENGDNLPDARIGIREIPGRSFTSDINGELFIKITESEIKEKFTLVANREGYHQKTESITPCTDSGSGFVIRLIRNQD